MDYWSEGVATAYAIANQGGVVQAWVQVQLGSPSARQFDAQGPATASVEGGDTHVLEGVCNQPRPGYDASFFPGPDGIHFWVKAPMAATQNAWVDVQFLVGDQQNTFHLDVGIDSGTGQWSLTELDEYVAFIDANHTNLAICSFFWSTAEHVIATDVEEALAKERARHDRFYRILTDVADALAKDKSRRQGAPPVY